MREFRNLFAEPATPRLAAYRVAVTEGVAGVEPTLVLAGIGLVLAAVVGETKVEIPLGKFLLDERWKRVTVGAAGVFALAAGFNLIVDDGGGSGTRTPSASEVREQLDDVFPTGLDEKEALLDVAPLSGPPGTEVVLSGRGFKAGETVQIRFHTTSVARISADGKGTFSKRLAVPDTGFRDQTDFVATGLTSVKTAEVPFLVT